MQPARPRPAVDNPCDPWGRTIFYPRIWLVVPVVGLDQGGTLLFGAADRRDLRAAAPGPPPAADGRRGADRRGGSVLAGGDVRGRAGEHGPRHLLRAGARGRGVAARLGGGSVPCDRAGAADGGGEAVPGHCPARLPARRGDRRTASRPPRLSCSSARTPSSTRDDIATISERATQGQDILVRRPHPARSALPRRGGRRHGAGAGRSPRRSSSRSWPSALLAVGAWLVWRRRSPTGARDSAAEDPRETSELLAFRMGALVYLGTFVVGNSFDYRLVCLLLVLPQLLRWPAGGAGGAGRDAVLAPPSPSSCSCCGSAHCPASFGCGTNWSAGLCAGLLATLLAVHVAVTASAALRAARGPTPAVHQSRPKLPERSRRIVCHRARRPSRGRGGRGPAKSISCDGGTGVRVQPRSSCVSARARARRESEPGAACCAPSSPRPGPGNGSRICWSSRRRARPAFCFQPASLARTLVAFVAFCLASSGMYFFNDVRDRTRDAEHPTKRFRPVAAGELSPAIRRRPAPR